jgi:hypothetical protein
MPILNTVSEAEFRANKDFVDATRNFFNSDAGKAFSAALAGGDPMTLLADHHNRSPANVRDLSLAEQANPHGLLGTCKGYRMCCQFMDDLMAPIEKGKKAPGPSHAQRVAKVLKEGREGED